MNEHLEKIVTDLEDTCVTTIYLRKMEDWTDDETKPEWAAGVLIMDPTDALLVVRVGLDDNGGGQVVTTAYNADYSPTSPEVTVLGDSVMITS